MNISNELELFCQTARWKCSAQCLPLKSGVGSSFCRSAIHSALIVGKGSEFRSCVGPVSPIGHPRLQNLYATHQLSRMQCVGTQSFVSCWTTVITIVLLTITDVFLF